MKDFKNRNREKPTFANINLQGICNFKCFFCIGNEIEDETRNYLNVHFNEWKNFKEYLKLCKENDIKKIYLTGQNTDPLLYKYLDEIIEYLKSEGFEVGIRTNGVLTLKNLEAINKINDKVSISIHTLNENTLEKITGVKLNIDWDKIINSIKVPLRIALVVNRYNKDEVLDTIKYLSKFKNISYIQLRCIATDNYYEYFKEDIDDFLELSEYIDKKFKYKKSFYTSKIYEIYGKEVSLWRTISTTINSFNYFTNGIISDDYFIVEGYNKGKKEGN